MKKICYGVFLIATFLFAYGVWAYEWLFWADHAIFFSLGSALLFCFAALLLGAGTKKRCGITFAGIVCCCYWLLSIIPLIQKTCWTGSSKQNISIKVLDVKTGHAIPGA